MKIMISLKLSLFIVLIYINYNNNSAVNCTESQDQLETSTDTSDRSAQTCGLSAREKCLEPMRKVFTTKHVSYGKNENELSDTCKKMQKLITCFDKYLEECKSNGARIREKVANLMSGQQKLHNTLCDDNSQLRQRYLSYAHCIEYNSKDTIQCFKNYEKELLDTMNEMPLQSQKFGYIQMDSICCALERHNTCTRLILESRCNVSAADLSEQLFQMSRTDVSADCERHRSNRHCSGGGGSQITWFSPNIITVLSLFALIF